AFSRQQAAQEPHDFCAALETLLGYILAAQPSMAVLINLAQQGLQACSTALPLAAIRPQLQRAPVPVRHDVRHSTEMLCQQAFTILAPQATVLTYSNSATVIAALRYAHERGRVRRVLLSESRPAYDGRLQALALLESGLAVEYSIDMGLFERLAASNVAVVG